MAFDASEVPDGEVRPDPNLLYRRVEIQSWSISGCKCSRSRRYEFEVCGCKQPVDQVKKNCHERQGVLVTYKLNLQLEVTEANSTTLVGGNAVGHRVMSLDQASCKPVYSGESVKQICEFSSAL